MPSLIFRGTRVPPAQNRVIVVSSRIDDFLGSERVWKMGVGTGVAESELQNRHAGYIETLSKRVDVRGDVPKVFGKKRKSSENVAYAKKKILFRAVDPTAILRGFFGSRDLPELRETSEMIEPDVIKVASRPTQTIDPPRISAFLHHIPTVQGIAP